MRFLVGKTVRSPGWKVFCGFHQLDFQHWASKGWWRIHIGCLKVINMPDQGAMFERKLHYRGLWLRIDVFIPITMEWS